jgi:hypothetical protein
MYMCMYVYIYIYILGCKRIFYLLNNSFYVAPKYKNLFSISVFVKFQVRSGLGHRLPNFVLFTMFIFSCMPDFTYDIHVEEITISIE